jgi:hypothetical protein
MARSPRKLSAGSTPRREIQGAGSVTTCGTPAKASAGWLGRDGRFWPCAEWQHESSGASIIRELGFQTGGMSPKDYLMLRRHWIVVYIDGSTLGTSMPFNQAQMDTMFDLAQAQSLMRRELMAALAQGRATTKAELYGGSDHEGPRVQASVT